MHSKESDSNTPDYIIAEYLVNCLDNYNKTVRQAKEDSKDFVKVELKSTKLPDMSHTSVFTG